MRRFILSIAFASLISITLHAQQSDWQWLDFGLQSGFREDDLRIMPEHFQKNDSLWWFMLGVGGLNETTDGGRTWLQRHYTTAERRVPIPHRKTIDGLFYSNAAISFDTTQTWQRFGLSYLEAPVNGWIPSLYSRQYGCANLTTEINHPDSPSGVGKKLILHRLAATTDGRKTWQLLDSAIAVVTPDTVTTTITNTIFGKLPSPPDFMQPIHQWYGAPEMLDSSMIRAVCLTKEVIGSKRQRYFIGYLNRASKTAKWYQLPNEFSSVKLNLSAPVHSVLYLQKSVNGVATLMRSVDSGATWGRVTLPNHLSQGQIYPLHCVGHSVIIGELLDNYSSAKYEGQFVRSTDGGATWDLIASPYRRWGNTEQGGIDGGTFYTHAYTQPIDSLRIALLGDGAMFFLSEDAGKTWRKNGAGGFPFATAGSKVLLGRELQTLLYSDNEGMTWRELGAEGKLPSELSAVFALAFVDTANPNGNVVGVGAFIGHEGKARLSMIHSDNGGISWSEGWKIPDSLTTNIVGPTVLFRQLPHLKFYRSSNGLRTRGFLTVQDRLFTSDDGGKTWQHQNGISLAINGVAMLNADVGLTADTLTDRTAQLLKTTDGGMTWNVIYTTQPGAYPASYKMFGSDTIRSFFSYAGTPDVGCVVMSNNGGKTWDSVATSVVSGGLLFPWFVHWIDRNTFYNFWINNINRVTIQQGADTAAIEKIEIPQQPYSYLMLRAYGASSKWFYVAGDSNVIARFPVPASTIVDPPATAASSRLIPNIAAENVGLQLPALEEVTVAIYNIVGSEVMRLQPSSRQIEIDVRGLAVGQYIVQVASSAATEYLPLLVLR